MQFANWVRRSVLWSQSAALDESPQTDMPTSWPLLLLDVPDTITLVEGAIEVDFVFEGIHRLPAVSI